MRKLRKPRLQITGGALVESLPSLLRQALQNKLSSQYSGCLNA